MEKLLQPRIVSHDTWLAERKLLQAKEEDIMRRRDEIYAERRALPWVKIDKAYVFEGPGGKTTLQQLFNNRSQLIVYHFMFGPGWEEGCPGCSFLVDHIGGALVHLENHDVTFVAVSRAPLAAIDTFKKRMGWQFDWVSSAGSDFNFDFHVSFTKDDMAKGQTFYNFETQQVYGEEMPGLSVFYKDERGDIFHTYSAYGRAGEDFLTTYTCLDVTPKGRNENGPFFDQRDWVRHHDKYDSIIAVKRQQVAVQSSCCSSAKEDAA